MKNYQRALPTLLMVLGSQALYGMTFKAQIQPLKLPRTLMMSQPSQVPDTVSGELSVGLMRMCGDGDVARFSQTHPEFDFISQDQKKLDVVAGYWITDADEKNPAPKKENFYPVAYMKDLDIAESNAGIKFSTSALPINHAVSTPLNVLKMLSLDMINVYKNATRSYGAKKAYRLYAGVFTCRNVDDGSALVSAKSSDYKFNPSPVEITNVFTHPLGLKAKAETEAVSDGSDKMKMSVSTQPKNDSIYSMEPDESGVRFSYQFKFESGGEVNLAGTKAFTLYKKIMAFELPQPESTLSAEEKVKFYNDKIAEMKASLGGTPGTSEQERISYCRTLDLDYSEEKSPYKWEVFPMNASCKFLHDELSLSEAHTQLFQVASSMTVMPDATKFLSLKRNLAKRFYAANAIEVAQKSLNGSSSLKISHANCFNSGTKPVIYSLVGSYPLHFSPDPGGSHFTILPNVNNHVHPEPLFAIQNYTKYFESDTYGVWAQVIQTTPAYTPSYDEYGMGGSMMPEMQEADFDAKDWSVLLPVNDKVQLLDRKIEGKTFQVPGINIQFKIRSINGSCPGYC